MAVDEVVAPVGLGAEAMESSVRSFAEGQPRRGPFPWDGGVVWWRLQRPWIDRDGHPDLEFSDEST